MYCSTQATWRYVCVALNSAINTQLNYMWPQLFLMSCLARIWKGCLHTLCRYDDGNGDVGNDDVVVGSTGNNTQKENYVDQTYMQLHDTNPGHNP